MSSSLREVPREQSRAQKIDRFGELDRLIRLHKPIADEYEKLKNEIKGWFDGYPAEQTATAAGRLYEIQVSARGKERKIRSMMMVYKAVGGLQKFFRLCTVPLSALEELLGKEKTAELVAEEQTGSRRLKAVARAAAGAVDAA